MTTQRECGDCTMCCKLLGVPELDKPSNTWCQHCAIGVGCKIYDERPQSCRNFNCLWVQGVFGEDLKPSKCRAVFAAYVKDVVQVHVDVGRDWHAPPIGPIIDKMSAHAHVVVTQGSYRTFIKGAGLPMPDAIKDAVA